MSNQIKSAALEVDVHRGNITLEYALEIEALEEKLSIAERKLAALPADWLEDSSLETWFPHTAKHIKLILAEHSAMAERLIEIDEVHRGDDGTLVWSSCGDPVSKP